MAACYASASPVLGLSDSHILLPPPPQLVAGVSGAQEIALAIRVGALVFFLIPPPAMQGHRWPPPRVIARAEAQEITSISLDSQEV